MNFIDILVIASFTLVCVLFVGVLGYAIFSPISTKSIRKLKKELDVNLDEDKLIHF